MSSGIKKLFLRTIGKVIPSDVFAYRMPVSVKGVCFIGDRVILLKNEHGQWDIPGGKLRKTENLEKCLQREFYEEVGIEIQVEKLQDAYNLMVQDKVNVLILIYECSTLANLKDMRISQESFDLQSFTLAELKGLQLSAKYLENIQQIASQRTG